MLDLDIRSFFDTLSQKWLVKFVEHGIGDRRVVRLIQKWLRAGVLEEGKLTVSEEGTPQGGSASSLPANIYLHYVFDLWAKAWRRKIARRDILVLRFADDIVMGLQEKIEAEQFWSELKVRPGAAPGENAAAGVRPFCGGATAEALRRETGNFQLLGFTHIGGRPGRGGSR